MYHSLMGDEIEAVRRANQSFYRAFESLELGRMDEVWAHEGQVTCIHPGWALAEGWAAVRRTWERLFRHRDAMQFTVENERIDVRGDFAWVVCVERLGRGALIATNVFRRDHGRWLMVHHHASPFVLPATAPKPSPFN
jgi:ketosteroid isomerase-like protein